MNYTNPGQLFLERFGAVNALEDILAFANYLREESGIKVYPPVDLELIFNRFSIPQPETVHLSGADGMLVNPERGLILLNEEDPHTRQRFTAAHELIEILFERMPPGKGWAQEKRGGFKKSAKEYLCNVGAAELLMPSSVFSRDVRKAGVSFESAKSLARDYRVSVQASLIQMAQTGPGTHAIAVWRYKNKPQEIRRETPSAQLTFLEEPPAPLPARKLRIEWSFRGPNAPFLPTNKSVPKGTTIHNAWQDGFFTQGTDYLELTRYVRGSFKTENQPFQVNEETQVISLLHCPGDRCNS